MNPGPPPLTPQEVAATLRIAKNTVYELVKRGELTAFKVGNKFRFHAKDVEAYQNGAPHADPEPEPSGFILAGQDVLLDLLARRVEAHPLGGRVLRSFLGSSNGLHALYQGTVHAATAHLWDGRSGRYNLPFLPYLIPGTPLVVLHLATRTVGYYVAKGNPRQLASWEDLRRDLLLVNREPGSGMRVLLDGRLSLMGIPGSRVRGYTTVCTNHLAAAAAVAQGAGDFALGSEKAARQVDGVDFLPLQEERYDLIFKAEDRPRPLFQALVEAAQSTEFRLELEGLGGYGTEETGREVNQGTA